MAVVDLFVRRRPAELVGQRLAANGTSSSCCSAHVGEVKTALHLSRHRRTARTPHRTLAAAHAWRSSRSCSTSLFSPGTLGRRRAGEPTLRPPVVGVLRQQLFDLVEVASVESGLQLGGAFASARCLDSLLLCGEGLFSCSTLAFPRGSWPLRRAMLAKSFVDVLRRRRRPVCRSPGCASAGVAGGVSGAEGGGVGGAFGLPAERSAERSAGWSLLSAIFILTSGAWAAPAPSGGSASGAPGGSG